MPNFKKDFVLGEVYVICTIHITTIDGWTQAFFVKYKLIIVEIVKQISGLNPAVPLGIIDEWLR